MDLNYLSFLTRAARSRNPDEAFANCVQRFSELSEALKPLDEELSKHYGAKHELFVDRATKEIEEFALEPKSPRSPVHPRRTNTLQSLFNFLDNVLVDLKDRHVARIKPQRTDYNIEYLDQALEDTLECLSLIAKSEDLYEVDESRLDVSNAIVRCMAILKELEASEASKTMVKATYAEQWKLLHEWQLYQILNCLHRLHRRLKDAIASTKPQESQYARPPPKGYYAQKIHMDLMRLDADWKTHMMAI